MHIFTSCLGLICAFNQVIYILSHRPEEENLEVPYLTDTVTLTFWDTLCFYTLNLENTFALFDDEALQKTHFSAITHPTPSICCKHF